MTDLRQAAQQALEALEETTALCINYESVEEKNGYEFTEAKEVIPIGNAAITALRAALEQQAEPLADEWAKLLHYPDCWDTAAYPTLHDAVHEALACSGCSVCKLEQQAEPVGEVIDERGEVDYISYVPPVGTALYTTPPQRKPLTDDAVGFECRKHFWMHGTRFEDAYKLGFRDAEAAHNIKEQT